MKKLVLALSVLGLAVAPALAQTTPTFATVDANGDGQASMDKIKAAGVNLTEEQFASADADGSGSLSEEEYTKATAG
jgi:hypothetical protein